MTKDEFKSEVIQWADTIRVQPKEIHLRPMKKKWASCSSKGRLSFNLELLEEPKKKRDHVIVHELLHLRYPSHGKMFQQVLNKYLNS